MVSGGKPTGLYSKIENKDGNYIQYNYNLDVGTNEGASRYYDALEIFKSLAVNNHNFILQ